MAKGNYNLPGKWVELVLTAYPDKDEEWVQREFARAYDNLDCPRQPNDEDIIKAILMGEFNMKEEECNYSTMVLRRS